MEKGGLYKMKMKGKGKEKIHEKEISYNWFLRGNDDAAFHDRFCGAETDERRDIF